MKSDRLSSAQNAILEVLLANTAGLKIYQLRRELNNNHSLKLEARDIRKNVFEPDFGLKSRGLVDHNKIDFLYRITAKGNELINSGNNIQIDASFIQLINDLQKKLLVREPFLNDGIKNDNELFTLKKLNEHILKKTKLLIDEVNENPELVVHIMNYASDGLKMHLDDFPRWNKVLEIIDLDIRSEESQVESTVDENEVITAETPVKEISVNNQPQLNYIRNFLETIWDDGFFSDQEWQDFQKFTKDSIVDEITVKNIMDEFRLINQTSFNYEKVLNFHFNFKDNIKYEDASNLIFERYGVVLPRVIFETHKLTLRGSKENQIQKSDITIKMTHCTYLVEFTEKMTEINNEYEVLQLDPDYIKIYLDSTLKSNLEFSTYLIIDAITQDLVEAEENSNFDFGVFLKTRSLVRKRTQKRIRKELNAKFYE